MIVFSVDSVGSADSVDPVDSVNSVDSIDPSNIICYEIQDERSHLPCFITR